ncbi:galactokinase [Tessaracoccus sp. MC1865]|uniref:GHMP family kinase ATP-binding protein n=1 Tax=Tessaracoccus sp. MC1865 TaxID=2760310 RepID=UPI00160028E9|nr:galactokinase family protein [Tessaracoccus sp. MC1865]MBB1483852.1 galactokinase [Tessaracoccus sp. MC1865]QTO36908.1 galactokinase [Tessaracoccus sp. MC1865]
MKWFVPGRLEVLGKHTDYAGGRSLLAAVDRGITITLEDADEGFYASTTAVPGELTLTPGSPSGLPKGHWGNYVQATLDRLFLNFGELKPARVVIDSNLPLASGMSSSSALVVAVALAVVDHNDIREREEWKANIHSDIDLAGYMATMENGLTFGTLAGTRGVGTFGGSEDHTAMLCCHEGSLTEFTFCPIEEGASVALPEEWSFVVAVSGVLAEKTGAALESYNNASLRARELAEAWNDATGREDAVLADALASDDDALEGLRAIAASDEGLTRRLTAFVTESEVAIPQALKALQAGDLEAFGRAADLSQRNADEQLGNQIPETNRLQRLARELGAAASAGFGAGFGGSVWALVKTDEAEAFADRWLAAYVAEYPEVAETASTIVTRPGGPARRL